MDKQPTLQFVVFPESVGESSGPLGHEITLSKAPHFESDNELVLEGDLSPHELAVISDNVCGMKKSWVVYDESKNPIFNVNSGLIQMGESKKNDAGLSHVTWKVFVTGKPSEVPTGFKPCTECRN